MAQQDTYRERFASWLRDQGYEATVTPHDEQHAEVALRTRGVGVRRPTEVDLLAPVRFARGENLVFPLHSRVQKLRTIAQQALEAAYGSSAFICRSEVDPCVHGSMCPSRLNAALIGNIKPIELGGRRTRLAMRDGHTQPHAPLIVFMNRAVRSWRPG